MINDRHSPLITAATDRTVGLRLPAGFSAAPGRVGRAVGLAVVLRLPASLSRAVLIRALGKGSGRASQ